jgi:hypothetical protein
MIMIDLLRHIADNRPSSTGELTVYSKSSPGWLKQSEDEFDKGRFSAAVRPYYGNEIAPMNGEIDARQHLLSGIGKGKINHFHHRNFSIHNSHLSHFEGRQRAGREEDPCKSVALI